MGKKDKLIKRLKSRPKDFTFDEAETLLKYFDFAYSNKGKTSGSRVIFESENHGCIMLHKPHPQKELKAYQIKQLIEYLEQEGFVILRYLVAYYKFTPTFMKNSVNFTIEAFIPM